MMWRLVLDCIVDGTPVAKGRPRAVRMGKLIRMYTPEKVRAYEKKVAAVVRAKLASACEPVVPEGPVRVVLNVYHPRPIRLMRKKDPAERMMMPQKPDVDNVSKAILDGIGLAPLWTDDSQVVSLAVDQWRCAKDGEPRVEMMVYKWEEQKSNEDL